MNYLHTTINVSDIEKSKRFYQEIVGLPMHDEMHLPDGTNIAFLGNGDTKIELIHRAGNTEVVYGNDISIGFACESVDELIACLSERGIPICSGPFQPNPAIRFFYVQDPDGMNVQFVQHLA